jgi:hypothetical protein
MPRSHVVEVVLDADRLNEELRKENPGVAKAFAALDYDAKIRLVRKAFPFARYGW